MTSVKTARAEMVALLKGELSGWEIFPYVTTRTVNRKPMLMVDSPRVQRGKTHTIRIKTLRIVIVIGSVDPEKASDLLDDRLEEVLEVLDLVDGIVWQDAERSTYGEEGSLYPAYELNVTLED